MTKTTKQYRTAAAVIESIRARFDEEGLIVRAGEAKLDIHRTRRDVLHQILTEALKNGTDDAEKNGTDDAE